MQKTKKVFMQLYVRIAGSFALYVAIAPQTATRPFLFISFITFENPGPPT
jgi:hypothetical protein